MKRAIDLCCKAGGVSVGLHQAGFEVVGVDIEPQPNYPFKFIRANALEVDLSEYDFVWASWPCQAYTWSAKRWKKDHPDLIGVGRERLAASGKPWIMENVVGAPLKNPIRLCGEMFSLGVIRHRLFESNLNLQAPSHKKHHGSVRGGEYVTVAGHGGDGCAKLEVWQKAMGINWMTKQEMTQAIPPAYAKYLGEQVLQLIS